MSIASLVLGLLWLYGLGSILAIVFGVLGRRQASERGESGEGTAIAGIILGGVGLIIMVIIVANAASDSYGYY
jgi:hypothetical protein